MMQGATWGDGSSSRLRLTAGYGTSCYCILSGRLGCHGGVVYGLDFAQIQGWDHSYLGSTILVAAYCRRRLAGMACDPSAPIE